MTARHNVLVLFDGKAAPVSRSGFTSAGTEEGTGALLADSKFAFETTQEMPKTHAEHPVYGRVLVLNRQGGTQWMTVRFDEKTQKAVLDREFRLADAAGY